MRAFPLLSVLSLLASPLLPASGSVIYSFEGVTADFFEVPVSFVYTHQISLVSTHRYQTALSPRVLATMQCSTPR
jgi:hypothetical protein